MARPSDGTTNATESRTAVLAAVAARAKGKAKGENEGFFKKNRLGIGSRDAQRALALRRRPAGPKAPTEPDQREWAWESYEIDPAKLGLELILAWLPRPAGPGRRPDQARLLAALKETPGVIGIHDCFDDTVLVLALSHDPAAKRRLQARLDELCPDHLWSEVRQTDFDQPGRGFLDVARAVASQERRLRPLSPTPAGA